MMNTTAIPEIKLDPIDLPQRGSWPESVHRFDAETVWAVRAALAAQRPLLVRGEPGSGKSQDLLWRFDALGRLGDAQAMGAGSLTPEEVRQRLAQRNYLSPGALWWVFDWQSALAQHQRGGQQSARPQPPTGWTPEHGSVLLIDEIDKAEADLPNGLLETLGNGAFTVPWLEQAVSAPPGTPTPLVVITTNEERELPAAFVRRCLVLNLQMPREQEDFIVTLIERGRLHFGERCTAEVYREAAGQLWQDRQAAEDQGLQGAGQAEYLDLLRVVVTLAPEPQKQSELLAKVRDFALRKHPPAAG